MIREALSAVARHESLGGIISRTPGAREVVRRVVGGDTLDEAMVLASHLADEGLWVSLERAAPAADGPDAAEAVLAECLLLVDRIADDGLGGTCEVAVIPEALGMAAQPSEALGRLDVLCDHALARGVEVTVGMGPASDVAPTVAWALARLAAGRPVGITLQAALRRTEADCARLAGHRVRLVKGGHRPGPDEPAFVQPIEIDKAYVRGAKVLLRGDGSPSFATHDPRLIEIVGDLAERYGRDRQGFEYAFYLGRMEGEQRRLSAAGQRVRVYVPYGPDWFERLVGGLAEQPTGIVAAVRSLLPG